MKKKQRETFGVLPLHLTADKKEKHVNLLLIENNYIDEHEDGSTLDDDVVNIDFKFHYVWIKNLSRLCSKQLSSRNHKTFICDRSTTSCCLTAASRCYTAASHCLAAASRCLAAASYRLAAASCSVALEKTLRVIYWN